MATRTVPWKVLNYTSLYDYFSYIETMISYLEKATKGNLGDFTEEGKVVNAGYNNYTVYWDWYNKIGYGNYQGQPYCAGFISSTLASAFGIDIAKKLLCGDLFVYCPTGYNQFNNAKRIHTTPEIGDIVFFWSTSLKRWGHVGVVVGVDSNKKGFTTIEANTTAGNDIVVRNGGATCRKHYTLGEKKMAFGRPDYKSYGISTQKSEINMVTYSIGTGVNGLIATSNINLRRTPGTDSSNKVIGTLKKGTAFYPTLKAFVNGDPWIYSEQLDGWISAKYVEGWMQEFTCHNKWWFVENGYTCPIRTIKYIDNVHYYFDDAGYMFRGSITLKTDANGALKIDSVEEE